MAGTGPGAAPQHLQTAGHGYVANFCMSAGGGRCTAASWELAGEVTLPRAAN